MIHPARAMEFNHLIEGLREAKAAKLVSEQVDGNLRLYCYTQNCVYDRGWSEITLLARGLILDVVRKVVVATPFPKFFNIGEREQTFPDLPFDTFVKMDGSLIIIWYDGNMWRCATKGSFHSRQANAAQILLHRYDLRALCCGSTYLAEYIGPENRIVIPYEREELVLLTMYDEIGVESSYEALCETAQALVWRTAERHTFASVSDLIAYTSQLPATEEGFVLRFSNGLRLKIKGNEYLRIHKLISGCTPLAIWEAMQAGDDLTIIRKKLPEEFWIDFDRITLLLEIKIQEIISGVSIMAAQTSDWTDKEVGLSLGQWPELVRPFIFTYRKNGGDLMTGKARIGLFRAIRPTGNVLDGYTPSYAMNRVTEDLLG